MTAIGYAAKVDGVIDMRSVGPTERSAKVNALMTLFMVAVTRGWTDEMIDAAWKSAVESVKTHPISIVKDVQIVPVMCHETNEGMVKRCWPVVKKTVTGSIMSVVAVFTDPDRAEEWAKNANAWYGEGHPLTPLVVDTSRPGFNQKNFPEVK